MKKLLARNQTFQKFRSYELGHIKIELINQDKWYGHNCTLKYLECILLIPSLIWQITQVTTNMTEPLLNIWKNQLHQLRPHLDYGDVIYIGAFNESFQSKLESVQYNTALVITGAIRGSSREKLYQELGLESLKSRRWYWKLYFFFKLKKKNIPLTYLIWFPPNSYQHGLPETITTSLYLLLNMNTSETLFSIHCYWVE